MKRKHYQVLHKGTQTEIFLQVRTGKIIKVELFKDDTTIKISNPEQSGYYHQLKGIEQKNNTLKEIDRVEFETALLQAKLILKQYEV